MKLEIKCFATLASQAPTNGVLEMPAKSTVMHVMKQLQINPDEVKIIFVNGLHADADTVLKDGDRVGLFPPVGGG
nr:MoaD/ThiS family protein [Desulfovibrio litoralis]